MKAIFSQIKNHINSLGHLVTNKDEVQASISAAEQLGESLLGCTLNVRGNKFVIRMLEIYYGGIGDDAHDWHRTRFMYKKSKYIEQTSIQNEEGFKVYLSSLDVSDTYNRMDIVVGNAGVPISYLLRSVWDAELNLIGKKNGSPNIVLKAMGIQSEDHGKVIEIGNENSEISLENTHEQIIQEKGFKIKKQRRINLKSDFENRYNTNWNLYLE